MIMGRRGALVIPTNGSRSLKGYNGEEVSTEFRGAQAAPTGAPRKEARATSGELLSGLSCGEESDNGEHEIYALHLSIYDCTSAFD